MRRAPVIHPTYLRPACASSIEEENSIPTPQPCQFLGTARTFSFLAFRFASSKNARKQTVLIAHATSGFKVRGPPAIRGHSEIKTSSGRQPWYHCQHLCDAHCVCTGSQVNCDRFREIGSLLFIASYANWLISFFLGTNCFEPIPQPLGVATAALRSRATAKEKR